MAAGPALTGVSHLPPSMILAARPQDFNYSARDKSGINMDCLPTREVSTRGGEEGKPAVSGPAGARDAVGAVHDMTLPSTRAVGTCTMPLLSSDSPGWLCLALLHFKRRGFRYPTSLPHITTMDLCTPLYSGPPHRCSAVPSRLYCPGRSPHRG